MEANSRKFVVGDSDFVVVAAAAAICAARLVADYPCDDAGSTLVESLTAVAALGGVVGAARTVEPGTNLVVAAKVPVVDAETSRAAVAVATVA